MRLGDLVFTITHALGIRRCPECELRQRALNYVWQMTPPLTGSVVKDLCTAIVDPAQLITLGYIRFLAEALREKEEASAPQINCRPEKTAAPS